MYDEYAIKVEIESSVLDALSYNRIFHIDKSPLAKNHIRITECCDHYFSIDLDKEEVERLIEELIVWKDSM